MAYNREAFKNVIEEHMGYALLEFYKVKLAARIGQARKAADRIARIRDLLERNLVVTVLHEIRGFKDRRSAIEDAVNEMKTVDEAFRGVAEKMVSASNKARSLRTCVSADDTAEFWSFFDVALEVALRAADPG